MDCGTAGAVPPPPIIIAVFLELSGMFPDSVRPPKWNGKASRPDDIADELLAVE